MTPPARTLNAMTVDVEDWFQVQAFAHRIRREDWPGLEARVEANIDRILAQFAAAGVHATFFTLGWVALRHPAMVRRIVAAGHELASHGWDHTRADSQDPAAFRADVRRARSVLEEIGGVKVTGYRAATFSIGASNPWAFTVLAEEGYRYSSSVNPIRHDLYGMPNAPRIPYSVAEGSDAGNPHDDPAPRQPQLAVLGRRLFSLAALRRLAPCIGAGEPKRPPGRHLLFPSMGDRPRPAARAGLRLEVPAQALYQPRPHDGQARPLPCATSPGIGWTGCSPACSPFPPLRSPRRSPPPPDPAETFASMPLRVRQLDETSNQAWDAFVEATPSGTFFHRAAWARVIETAFGHRTHYVYAERDGAITGVLPLAQVHTWLFGHSLISVPFCVYGGVLGVDAESIAALEAHASALLQQTGAQALELRDREPAAGDWLTRPDLYVTFRKPITGDHEGNMKAIPRKQRAMVRKGIQNQLVSLCSTETRTLHRVYAESVRNLGTPVFSRRYFEILTEAFRSSCEVVTVLDREQPLAAVLNFYFRDEVLPYYGGGTADARRRAGNDFMYWEVMRRAADRGCRMFDFGRSKLGTGAYAFKHNWGFDPAPLHYRYRLAPGAAIPDHNPLNPKYRLFIAAWKRLPLPVTTLLGPQIVRGLG